MRSDDRGPVLILAPGGRDGQVAAAILAEVGIGATVCADLDQLVAALNDSGAAIVAEEALLRADRRSLAEWIERQPPWSDFPFVLLTFREGILDSRMPELLGNVTILERPFHPRTLVSVVRSALRARRRQREAEAFLAERERTEQRQALLIRELHHRVKNTLATVQALVGSTARSTNTVDEFYHAFSDRIVSLAKTHSLLTEDYWQMASLREILENELGPYDDESRGRIRLSGPPLELSADLAVPTGMAIHELTTNAVKHGALSVPDGRVEVAWEVKALENGRRLHLEWIERDGPLVAEPTRRGFGSTLLQRVLTAQVQAQIDIDYQPTGLRFTMDAPLVEHRHVPQY
jgi:two-component sensor histidine kinase